MNRPKIHWVTADHDLSGNALGYATHVKFLRKHAEKYMDLTFDSDIALQICPADFFVYIKNKFNVLFTMWEFLEIPNKYIGNLQRADAIIVPSAFCRDLFKQYTDKPIYVCNEGVEAESFPFYQRRMPNFDKGEKFWFLWVGAPNPRKGYPLMLEAIKMLENEPHIGIYIKTTRQKINRDDLIKNIFRQRRRLYAEPEGRKTVKLMLEHARQEEHEQDLIAMGKHKNVIFDRRKLSTQELSELYGGAHCFILPTFGEGWGLTLCEAMSTGAPCIATPITGCKDFFNSDVGFLIDYGFAEQELTNYDNLISMGYVPHTNSMVKQMITVFRNYPLALQKGQKAAELIRKKFTWDISAKRLKSIIQEIEAKHLCVK